MVRHVGGGGARIEMAIDAEMALIARRSAESRHFGIEHQDAAPAARAFLQARARGVPRAVARQDLEAEISPSTLVDVEWNALVYAGHTIWNRHYPKAQRGTGQKKRRPRGEWEIQRDTHEALISEAQAEAILAQLTTSNIGAAVSFHTHSGVILRPMGTQSDDDMTPEDLWMYKRLSDLGAKTTGYPAISIYHEFKYHPKEIITGTQDWVYEHLGALFWTVELWAPNREAGITDYQWIEWYRDHPVEDDLKLLKWSDEKCGGNAHVTWYPFRHPQLGMVELGGWDKMNFWRNPPPELREREAARFPPWLMQLALSLPKLEILRAEVRALGPDTWRVRFAVANAGYLPSYVSKRALQRKVARGTVFQIHLPPGVSLIGGQERVEAGHLEGHAPKNSLQAFLPNRDITGDRAVVEWVVSGKRGTAIALSATADRAGTVRAEVTLD